MKLCLIFLASCILLATGAARAGSMVEVGRDGRFVAFSNGVVADTETGLEWIAGPDVDTSYIRPWSGSAVWPSPAAGGACRRPGN